MDELKWTMLIEVFGRPDAEMIKSYLESNGIDVELIQEGYQHSLYPISNARVQVFVPKDQLVGARKLYEESGWELEITDDDDEPENNEAENE